MSSPPLDSSSPLNLHQLIDEPFGPYPEGKILSESLHYSRRGVLLQLKDVWMVSDKKPTGLDHTEYAATPPTNLPPVQFYGVLHIPNLKWLSDTGRRWLQAELRDRDMEENDVEESGLTLEALYGDRPADGSRISVYIECEKNMKASFLTKTEHPEKLIFNSVVRDSETGEHKFYRKYEILSFDVETYSKSRNYLERWRFYALLKELIKKNNEPPIEKRTPAWIVEGMIKKHQDSSRHQRHIYAQTPGYDSDVDEEGYTTRPRHPRHISKSAAYHILAMHAEWFLAFQLSTQDSRHHIVDLRMWYEFCLKVKKAKQAARKAKGTKRGAWGREPRNKGEKDLENEWRIDLDRHGTVDGGWEDRIKKKCINVKPKKTKSKSAVPDEDAMEVDGDFEEDAPEPVFDSDFTVESSPPASDSDYDDSDSEPLSTDIIRRVPWYVRTRPKLLPGHFEWFCPDDECDFRIDFLNIQHSSVFSDEEYRFLRSKSWSVYDERVQNLILRVVSKHYEEHLKSRGLVVIRGMKRNKPKVRLELWNPYEQPRSSTVDSEHEHVKQEVDAW